MTANWSIRHLVCQAYGCELAVMWRADGRWTWIVSVAGERIAGGISQSMEGAKDAAVDAADRSSAADAPAGGRPSSHAGVGSAPP